MACGGFDCCVAALGSCEVELGEFWSVAVPVVDELLGCELIDPVLGVAALPLELLL